MRFLHTYFMLSFLFFGLTIVHAAAVTDESKNPIRETLVASNAFQYIYNNRVVPNIKHNYRKRLQDDIQASCLSSYRTASLDNLHKVCKQESIVVEGKSVFEFEDTCRTRLTQALAAKIAAEIELIVPKFEKRANEVLATYKNDLTDSLLGYLTFKGLEDAIRTSEERMQRAAGLHFFGSMSVYASSENKFFTGTICIMAIKMGRDESVVNNFLLKHNQEFDACLKALRARFYLSR